MKKDSQVKLNPKIKAIAEIQDRHPSGMEKIEQYLVKRYKFQYNEVTGRIEGQSIGQIDYHPITDYILNSLTREMNKIGISCGSTMLRNLLFSNFTPVFNPFKNYFEKLPTWDKTTDYIQQLAEKVNTTNDPFWHICFRKWLVAMVGSLLNDNVVNHTVIVLSGGQGIGKTTFMLNIVPQGLKDYCYSGTINPNNKDTLIQLSECMLINLDELENLNRSELNAMKEIITKASIRIRRPYGFTSETLPRRASFAGSVNGKEFLNDTTGNRRFLCFEVISIDYLTKVPLELVYAQALHLFNSGFRYWFNPSEVDGVNKNNEQFRCLSVEEEMLLLNFEPCIESLADWFLSTTEIIDWFSKHAKLNLTDAAKLKMGKALRANKFLRIKQGERYVYALKLKSSELSGNTKDFSPKVEVCEKTG
jgi:predicted P-loop ATPase